MNFLLLKNSAFALAAIASLSALSAAPASAAPVIATFNFNDMGTGNATSQGLGSSGSSSISAYMTSVMQSAILGSSVTVTGAVGQEGTNSYAGEGYVVGPVINNAVRPLTLGDTDGSASPNHVVAGWDSNPPTLVGSHDGFIKNCTSVDSCTSSPDIFINFNGQKISSFSFDFQIFPDGTCPQLDGVGHTTSCGVNNANLPDLEIWSGDNGTGTHFATLFGVAPNTAGTYKYSLNNSSGSGETAPQLLGTASYTVAAGTNISSLDFMDWPETIGIDNLVVNFIPPIINKIAEPPTIALLVFGLAGLVMMIRRKGLPRHLANGAQQT
jgi:hypothetical protein